MSAVLRHAKHLLDHLRSRIATVALLGQRASFAARLRAAAQAAGQSLGRGLGLGLGLMSLLPTLLAAPAHAAPSITLTAPGTGWSYNVPAVLTLRANAAVDPNDVGATLTRVEFYADGQLLGSDATGASYSLAWNPTAPGTRILTAKAIDSLGQETVSAPLTVTLTDAASNLAPTVTLSAPPNNARYALPVDLTLSASAADIEKNGRITQVEFLANGQVVGTKTASPWSISWSNPTPGSYTLTARATDNLGAVTESAARTVIVQENVGPTVSLTAPANNAKYALPVDLTVSASASDPERNGGVAQVEFFANGQLIGTKTATPWSIPWSNPTPGTYSLTARATDNQGAVTESAARTVIIQNNAPPTVSLGGPTTGTYLLPATLNFTASAAGGEINTPISQVEFLANGEVIATLTAKPYAFAWANPAPGTYAITARATDSQGLTTTSAARNYTLSATNTPPTVSLSAPANNASYVLPVDLVVSANATDLEKNGGITQVEFFANGQSIGTTTTKPYSLPWSNPAPGSYQLTAVATDTAGGQTTSAIRHLTVSDSNAPPRVSLTAPANRAILISPASVTLTASASGPEANTPVALVEFLVDGQVIGTTTTKPYSATWTTPALGTHSLTVRATDSLGAVATSAVRTVTINANQGPTVTLTSPTPNQIVAAPGSLTLTANATDSDGTIAKVEFYNGATLIGTATSAPYSLPWNAIPAGSYQITAQATDNLGGTTTSAPVTVTVDTPPSVTLTTPTSGTVLVGPTNVTLTASASDSDGTITQVTFLQNGSPIGTATTAPYSLTWNATPGSYQLTAQATDNLGVTTTSAPVTLTVIANSAPTISLTSPAPNLSAKAPATITLAATATDADNNLVKVEFIQGGTLIGSAFAAPWTATWSNVPQGSYTITAVATDAFGAQTTSEAIAITVTPAQASLYFIHPDHLGTPRMVTDETNNVVWRNLPTTEPFGNGTVEEDPNSTGNPFTLNLRFPGQYFDRETNLHYNYFRDYDPARGSYSQSDPIGLQGGINTYGYVGGNPVSSIDPEGLMGSRGNPRAHKDVSPPTISAFGCVGFGCLSGGRHDSDAQVSIELTLGGGLEICTGAPATPVPPSSSVPKQCKAGSFYDRDENDVIQPPGIPVPKRFGGVFFGPSIKADGRLCLRIGPHVSVPGVPSVDVGNLRGN